MWSIVHVEGGEKHRILAGRPYKLGRTNCDINIPGDKSISRHHATLEVLHTESNVNYPHIQPAFKISDSSKFGTTVQGQKITSQTNLKNSDLVKFGTMENIFTAVYEPYVLTASCLDPASKKLAKAVVARLGAHMVSDWRKECKLLVMTTLSVTVKVICALVSLKPIVTLEYLEKLAESIQEKTPEPDPDNFTPPLAESQLNPNEVSFKKEEKRKTLFQGKIFIFLNPKQFMKLNVAVELAGGTPMLMEEGTDDNEDDILIQGTTCVMHCDVGDVTQLSQNGLDWIKHVFKVLKKNGRRTIPDCEIGFAVLYCSTSRWCNPAIEAGSQITQSEVSVANTTISKDSQLPNVSVASKGREEVSQGRQTRGKRARENDEENTPALKVAKVKEEKVEEEHDQTQPITRNLRSSSRSPSPVPNSNASPNTTPKGKRSRGRHALSPSPSRYSASPSTSHTKTVKPDVKEGEDGEEVEVFDAFKPSSKRQSEANKLEVSREVSPEPPSKRPSVFSRIKKYQTDSQTQGSKTNKAEGDSVKTESVDPFEELEAFRPKSRRKRSPSPAPRAQPLSPEATPPRLNAEPVTIKPEPKSTKKEPPKQNARSSRKKDDNHTPAQPAQPNRDSEPKVEINEHVREDDATPPSRTDGWLTTTIPISEQEIKPVRRPDSEESVPDGRMEVVVKSLVIEKSKNQRNNNNNNTKNWGNVKNFKRFKKVMSAGSDGLPRVIGKSDLKVHANSARDVDGWFEEELKVDEERSKQSQEADALFSWEPAINKKRAGRR